MMYPSAEKMLVSAEKSRECYETSQIQRYLIGSRGQSFQVSESRNGTTSHNSEPLECGDRQLI